MSRSSFFAPAPVFADRAPPRFSAVNTDAFWEQVQAFRAGDRVATEVVAAHMYLVMRVLMVRLLEDKGVRLNRADFDDAQQELVLSALSVDLHRFEPSRGVPLAAFLRRRVRWRLNDVLRGQAKSLDQWESLEALLDDEVDFVSTEDLQGDLEGRERQENLEVVPHLVLLTLDDDDAREIIAAHDLEGESLNAIAKRRGVHPTTAGRMRHRGLEQLRARVPANMRGLLAA